MSIDFDKLKQIKEDSIEINKVTAVLKKLNQERLKKLEEKEESEKRAKYYPEALSIFEKLEANLILAALKGSSEYTIDEYFR